MYCVSLFVLNCGTDLALDRLIALLALEMKLQSCRYNCVSVTGLKPSHLIDQSTTTPPLLTIQKAGMPYNVV
jgi:hypothetical protein